MSKHKTSNTKHILFVSWLSDFFFLMCSFIEHSLYTRVVLIVHFIIIKKRNMSYDADE